VLLIGTDEMAYCLCMYCSSCFFSLIVECSEIT
jgi:hypothetical protein